MITVTILSAILVAGILMLFFMLRSRKKFSARDQKAFAAEWQKIISSAETDPRHAILQADALFDRALRHAGYRGTVGEMLKQAGPRFSNLDGAWEAHKLRNRIAHELQVPIALEQAERTLRQFSQAMRNLGLSL